MKPREAAGLPLQAVGALFLLCVPTFAAGAERATRRGSEDLTSVIQHHMQVASAQPAPRQGVQDQAVAALRAANEVALAASAELRRVMTALAAAGASPLCAPRFWERAPALSNLMLDLRDLQNVVDDAARRSAECGEEAARRTTEMPAPSGASLLAVDAATSFTSHDPEVFVELPPVGLDLSTIPGEFHRWHTEHFGQGFRLKWDDVAAIGKAQPQGCGDGKSGWGAEGDVGYMKVWREDNPPFMGESGLDGAPLDDSIKDAGSVVGSISPPADTNSTKGESRWDAIMKNGFKQMSNMIRHKDPPPRRSWLLLLVFIFLSLLVIAAILLISTPLITQNQEQKGSSEDARNRSNFIQVALVYWLPTTPQSTGLTFVVLFAGLILTCLSVNFWVGCVFLQILQHTDKKISDKVRKARIFNSHILQVICIVGALVAPVAFLLFRRQITGRWRQWRYLSLKMFLLFEGQILGIVGGYISRMQMNNIAAMDADSFWHVTRTIQLVMVAVGIIDQFASGYVDNVLNLDWRKFLTEHMLSSYMGGHAYYKMNSNSGKDDGADNPDQRMQSDVETFAGSLDSFVFSIIKTVMTLISSSIIVWTIMPKITMILLGYCTCGSLVSLLFTWRFVRLNYHIQKLEADYRYSMVHVRDNAEGIAFYGGENQGQGEITDRFHELLALRYLNIMWHMSFNAFQFFYTAIGGVLPMILLARMLFQARIDFGAVAQVGSNFAGVMDSLSFINRSATLLSNLGTSTNRLTGMLSKIESLQGFEEIMFHTTTDSRIKVEDLCVQTPDGRRLVQHLSLEFGDRGPARLLVVGRSGVGKSSLLRTLAGLWTQGSGDITMPPKGECMFLPQKPYMPLGTLRKQLCYPAVGHAANDSDLRSMLEELGLGDLPDRFEEGFDAVRDWPRVLSLGEQQRVAAIRAMIHQPTFVVLDESTSALSVLDEGIVYKRFEDLGMSFISIGHRMTVIKFHDQVLELLEDDGAYKIHTKAEYQKVYEKQEVQT